MPTDCANPLLAQWLKEWMDQAKERNSKGYTVYKKAYQSIIACPLRFDHPSEAQQLNGLGPKLCDRLTDKMKAFCEQNGLPMPTKGRKRKRPSEGGVLDNEDLAPPLPVPKRKAQQYVPKMRSGAYALIKALATLDQDSNEAIPKDRLIDIAQPDCNSNFRVPSDPTKFFTAWNSMKTLETKELVCTKGHPVKKYYLSDEGWEVALRIRAVETGLKPATRPPMEETSIQNASELKSPSSANEATDRPALVPRSNSSAEQHVDDARVLELSSDSDIEDRTSPKRRINCQRFSHMIRPQTVGSIQDPDDKIILPAGAFEVKMVLDTREIRTKTDRDYIADGLRKFGVVPIMRALPLGDVLWIAEVSSSYADNLKSAGLGSGEEGDLEIMLEHIMERKRLDDLISSIKDGRFHEQKFRLRKSGIKHVTYLIEEYSISSEKSDKYGDALESAIASMQVVNGYFVKQTSKLDDTIQYLARMTKTLKSLYEKQDIHVIPAAALEAEPIATVLDRARATSPGSIYGTTFSIFDAMCDKSESMTLRDVYLKMLMCTRGVTGEKAVEIQKIWPTPREFCEAYTEKARGSARDNMISDRLGNVIPKKKVAKTLSAKIAEVWS